MKRRLVLIISLVAGLVAAILTRVYISVTESELNAERERLRKKYGTINVLAFAKDTPAGTVIAKRDLGVKTVPALGMRGQALTEDNLADIIGRKTTVAHGKEEVLFWSDIEGGNPNAGGLSSDVKKQMRAMSINVSGAAAVAGMIKPNDHVDVIGTFNFPGDDGKLKRGDPVTCTILQNVLVLATGRETAKSVITGMQGCSGYNTVTLEVTPREAEMLVFAEQMHGRLSLTLRNPNDTSYESELPKVDFEKIQGEIEELNNKRQAEVKGR